MNILKKEVDLNLQAITTPLDLFKERWHANSYFDPKARPDAVLDWQESACTAPTQARWR